MQEITWGNGEYFENICYLPLYGSDESFKNSFATFEDIDVFWFCSPHKWGILSVS